MVSNIQVKKKNGQYETYKLIKLKTNKKNVVQKRLRSKLTLTEAYKSKSITSFSLRSKWPSIYNQGQIGSCTANAFCSTFKYLCDDKTFEPSRLYVYYKERLLENPDGPIADVGAFITDGYNWVCKHGVCPEKYWPYDVSKVNETPPEICDEVAKNNTVGNLFQVKMDADLHNSLSWCLLREKPIMIAFGVYQSFTKIRSDGLCPVPNPKSYYDPNDPVDPFYGGHEAVIVGFNDTTRLYTVANSWGEDWGDHGFFYMPYSYVENLDLVFDLSVILFSHSVHNRSKL